MLIPSEFTLISHFFRVIVRAGVISFQFYSDKFFQYFLTSCVKLGCLNARRWGVGNTYPNTSEAVNKGAVKNDELHACTVVQHMLAKFHLSLRCNLCKQKTTLLLKSREKQYIYYLLYKHNSA